MDFKITIEIDSKAAFKTVTIVELSQELNFFLKDKYYGDSIENLLVGCICIKSKEGYEDWFKKRKPRYIEYKKTRNKLTGLELVISKTFICNFKVDGEIYDNFLISNNFDSKKILIGQLFILLEEVKSHLKKINCLQLIPDLKTFAIQNGYIFLE